MKNKLSIAFSLGIVLIIVITSVASAQSPYPGYSWSTSYTVVNMGTISADISIDYFDSGGNIVTAAHRQYTGVPAGASRTVVQFTDDTALPPGRYSAVISSGQPVAAVLNQQLVQDGSTSFSAKPPFSSYSGATSGSNQVTLPSIMYNWYGYYTEVFIMNVGTASTNNVNISYIPGVVNGSTSGNTGVTDNGNVIAANATLQKSQATMSTLGATSGPWSGRFLGTAVITSGQPIIAVVNEHNVGVKKLMSYNGFASGSTAVALPQHMKNWYGGYFGSLLIGNPSPSATAHINITYTPDPVLLPGSPPLTVPQTVSPQTALNRYDGPGATASQSDLGAYTRFIGSVLVTSDIPVVVQENLEAIPNGADQAGAYNGTPVSEATQDIVVPLIQADFYGLYTSLTVQNVTGSPGSCTVTYTSDNLYSDVKNQSKSYVHPIAASGSFNVYEGHGTNGTLFNGDINSDTFWRVGPGMNQRKFIGSATIHCSVNAVAFVNSELNQNFADTMYTFNAINK